MRGNWLAQFIATEGVYVKVATTDDCPARHAAPHDGMENEDSVTAPPTPTMNEVCAAAGSVLVEMYPFDCTHTGGLDTVSPPTVIVTKELAETGAAVVTVTWAAPDHAADDPAAPLIVAEGAAETLNTCCGSVMLMLPPLDMAVGGINETEKEAPVWPVYMG
jgi:hypothetical protein